MTDDVMKKVESLLFDEEDEQEEEIREVKEVKEAKETAKETKETKEEKREREVRPKSEAQDCIEISFDGYAVVSGAKIKTLPGSEIEIGGMRLIFKDSKVMIFV